jgi:hypothetical protein
VIVENQPIVSPLIKSGRNYQLENDVTYRWDDKKIKILKGYVFDGASVPALLRWFIGPMDPRVIASSLIHDAIYTNPDLDGIGKYFVDDVEVKKVFTKAEADELFKMANQANGMDKFRTTLAFWAVRIFGRGNFKSL